MMATTTAAQDEYNDFIAKNNHRDAPHPEDRDSLDHCSQDELDEETLYRSSRIDAAMRAPTSASELKLPPASFDSGRSTGVKGVIADARSFETARKSKWTDRVKSARRSILGMGMAHSSGGKSESETDSDVPSGEASDEETFLQQWRETRRRELESEASRAVRTRRTSPSVRVYGRLDVVDASGYLDAIETVSRETKVVVFVYDHEVRTRVSALPPTAGCTNKATLTVRRLCHRGGRSLTPRQGKQHHPLRQGPLGGH